MKVQDKISFVGQTVCFTGTLRSPKHMTRNEATEIVIANGGKVSKTITRKTTMLVRGISNPRFDPSRKLSLAKSKSIKILSMDEFFIAIGLPCQLSFEFFC